MAKLSDKQIRDYGQQFIRLMRLHHFGFWLKDKILSSTKFDSISAFQDIVDLSDHAISNDNGHRQPYKMTMTMFNKICYELELNDKEKLEFLNSLPETQLIKFMEEKNIPINSENINKLDKFYRANYYILTHNL